MFKDHGHTHYHQATMLINCLRLYKYLVFSFTVAMAMAVMETHVFKVSRPYALLSAVGINCYLLLSFIVTMAMVVMGGMCVQSMYHVRSHT